jgi:hypothetical protein
VITRSKWILIALCLSLAACTGGPTPTTPSPSETGTHPDSSREGASPCATSVADFVRSNGSRADDTHAFAAAMAAAVAKNPRCYAAGPSDKPQAVVYAPPGIYRLSGLTFHDNVRLEVDAGATLQPPPNRPASPSTLWTPMILWDSDAVKHPLTNVSIVGVNAVITPRKAATAARLGAALSGFSMADYFTMNIDPAETGSTNYATGINLVNVRYFLIKNVFSIQNQTLGQEEPITRWPTSSRAVLQLYSRRDSPVGGPYYNPKDGRILNQVNIASPRGYGPNQVNSAQNVEFDNLFSEGGTTLRLETDGSQTAAGLPTRGSIVDGVRARHIVGLDCNRAVALVPHAQHNGSVVVSDVRAYSCAEAVVGRLQSNLSPSRRGDFGPVHVSDVLAVAGNKAQLEGRGSALWTVGPSASPILFDQQLGWAATVSGVASQGHFVG